MLHLNNERRMTFSFPEVHPKAQLDISLIRTLRVPDDGKTYPLPAGLGQFPMRHVDDYANRVPGAWLKRSGLMVPIYQAEALWISFNTRYIPDRAAYPFAIKIGTGKINAVTGEPWQAELRRKPQDYVVAPKQPWLDGYSVEKDVVRQFVAMPLGKGYTAEEQLTGSVEFGGIQIQAYPMKRGVFDKRFPKQKPRGIMRRRALSMDFLGARSSKDMGIAPGGKIKQQIHKDPYKLDDWDTTQTSRCFIHLCNSQQWRGLTGEQPPTKPITQQQYKRAGIPWFDHYDEGPTLAGSDKLDSVMPVSDYGKAIGEPLNDNHGEHDGQVIELPGKKVKDRAW